MDLNGRQRIASGDESADIDVVCDRRHPSTQRLLVEYRLDHVNVRQMLTACQIGVVGDENVTLADASIVLPDQMAQGVVETAQVHRRSKPLREVLSGGITERRRKVHCIANDWRVRR